ncbi:MAG TPA: chromate efflux transporter [Candidatus Saccharimonadales bacterium]|nr:chromate efflux transporter [Candidatus Saccharimonadales bacterium]
MCRYFLRLGALGFGGPVALAGYMQRDLVEDRGWISPQDYRDGLAIAQMAPGPLAAQLAMWLAFIRTGVRGATLASIAFVGPPFLLVVGLGWLYVGLGGAHWVGSLFYGIAPAAIAIIAVAAYRLLPLTVGSEPLLWAVAVAVGLVTYFSQGEVAVAFLVAGLLVVIVRVGPARSVRAVGERISGGRVAGLALVGPLLPAGATDPGILAHLALFFIKAGAFVFGSGLAIVPFLHQGVVIEHRWLTERQFVDAVAIGLITPGPVVITAAFIGFVVAGLPGALVGAFGVFLPAYLFVILPGPWILRHKDAVPVRAFVAGVSAAAAGAIVAASVILGRGAIHDAATLGIGSAALLALVAIRRWRPRRIERVAELLIVAAAGVAGLLLHGV